MSKQQRPGDEIQEVGGGSLASARICCGPHLVSFRAMESLVLRVSLNDE